MGPCPRRLATMVSPSAKETPKPHQSSQPPPAQSAVYHRARRFCGIDWAEGHHDVALVDAGGALIAQRRISDDTAGFALLLAMLADAGDSAAEPVPVAIETSPAGRLPAGHRPEGVRDQPGRGVPLP